VLSLDSGGNYHGYIGDVARMGVAGEPDAELVDLLAEVEAIEQASMQPIRAGVLGKEIYAAATSCCIDRSCTITFTSSPTAWGSSATKRRG
jgi:Xaa-Pro aminopeptidase